MKTSRIPKTAQILSILLFLSTSVFMSQGFAATYWLPAQIGWGPFSSCSGSGPDYDCASVTIGDNDVVFLTADVTLNISGNLEIGDGFQAYSNGFTLNFVVIGNVEIGNQALVSANISASGDVDIGSMGIFFGDITAGNNLEIGNMTWVNGNCSPAHPACTGTGGIDQFLIAEYRMDEASWNGTAGEVVDSSGNDLHGRARGGATAQTARVCNGVSLSGAHSGQYLEISDDPQLDIDDELTVTAWIRPDVIPSTDVMTIVSKDENFEFHVNQSGQIFWWWGGGIRYLNTTGTALSSGAWVHVAIVYSDSANRARIYINGVLRASKNISGALTVNNDPLQIGADQGQSSREFDGLIDEVRIYNTALDAAQINSVMNQTRTCPTYGPYAWFQLDETSGSLNGTAGELVDQQGNANAAFALGTGNGVDTLPAQVCNGLDVPQNSSNAAQYGFDSGIDLDDDIGGRGSISFWFKSDNNWVGSGIRTLFDASPDDLTSEDKYFQLLLRNNGQLFFGLEDSDDEDFRITSSRQNILANVWAHLAITWDMGGERRIYVNGNLVGSESAATNGSIGELRSLYFGDNRSSYHPTGGENSANGVFDEVRIYRAVQSAEEIIADMNATHPCPAPVLDHFNINIGSGAANSCSPFEFSITAEDASNQPLTGYTGTINITTSSSNGSFATVSANNNTNPNPDDDDNGNVDYSFDAADNGEIRMSISNPHIESLSLTVSDSSAGVSSSTAPATITFSEVGFTVSDIDANIAGSNVPVAGRDHAFRIEAVRRDPSSGICGTATGYTGVKALKLWRSKNTSDPASALAPVLAGSSLPANEPATSNGNINFTNGVADVSLSSSDIGKFTLEVMDDSGSFTAAPIAGTSAEQIVRPFGIGIDFGANLRNADFADNGVIDGSAGDISYAVDASGSLFTQAGEDFTTIISAVQWDSADDANNDGIPDSGAYLGNNPATPAFGQEGETIRLVASNPRPGSLGTLSGTLFDSFSNGAQSQSMSYSNVGLVDISASLSDGGYFGSGVDITGSAADLGRFNPFQYAVTGASINHGCSTGAFTYARQPFSIDLTLQAQNKGGGLTDGYRGGYVTLESATPPLDIENSASGAAYDNISFNLTGSFSSAPFGSASYNIELQWDMPLQAPSASDVQIIEANDEVVTVAGSPLTAGSTDMRFGRIALENVFGSELVGLTMPMRAEYFDGNNFILNGDDSCTDIPTLNLAVTQALSGGSSTVAVISETAVSGILDISLSAPGADNTGLITVTPNLSSAGSGEPWLQFDWDGDGNHDNDPSGRANFGVFSGDQRQIYYRQIYQ